jgi:hypothetical protein
MRCDRLQSTTRTWHVAGCAVEALGTRSKAQLARVAIIAGALVDACAHAVAAWWMARWQG